MTVKLIALILGLSLSTTAIRAENTMGTGQNSQPGAVFQQRSLSVLPSSDSSTFNLGPSLQYALSTLFQQTNYYNVQMGSYALAGFTEAEVTQAYRTVGTEIMTFVYLEPERISIYLFDMVRPREFIAVSQQLVDPMVGNEITPQVIEYKFRAAYEQLMQQYFQGQFQPLPGTQTDQVAANNPDDPKVRAEQSRKLFRELAALQEGDVYIGGQMGMARFAGGEGSSSSVLFGAFIGMRASEKIKVELGGTFFNYALLQLDGKYKIPFAEKYVSLAASLGAATVVGSVVQPLNVPTAVLESGAFFAGPGISFEVPLLGATVRGEMKFYFGSGTILQGSYAICYTL